MSKELTHFDAHGASRMVDVGEKSVTDRVARAEGRIEMAAETATLIRQGGSGKGDVLEVARLAGIMAAKKTSDLIPLCHPLPLDGIQIDFSFVRPTPLRIEATVLETARTGVEM